MSLFYSFFFENIEQNHNFVDTLLIECLMFPQYNAL